MLELIPYFRHVLGVAFTNKVALNVSKLRF